MGGKQQRNNQPSTGMAQVGGDWQRERLGAARRRRDRTMKMGGKRRCYLLEGLVTSMVGNGRPLMP